MQNMKADKIKRKLKTVVKLEQEYSTISEKIEPLEVVHENYYLENILKLKLRENENKKEKLLSESFELAGLGKDFVGFSIGHDNHLPEHEILTLIEDGYDFLLGDGNWC
ncbi:MAG: hypothetical protein ACUZ8H_14015 [Candidatus Anammoxibacter sp.]